MSLDKCLKNCLSHAADTDVLYVRWACADPEGAEASGHVLLQLPGSPGNLGQYCLESLHFCHFSELGLKNHKNRGFLSNTDPYTLENQEATKTAFNVEPSSARFAGRPMMVHLEWYFDPRSPHQLKKNKKATPSDKTFWIRA